MVVSVCHNKSKENGTASFDITEELVELSMDYLHGLSYPDRKILQSCYRYARCEFSSSAFWTPKLETSRSLFHHLLLNLIRLTRESQRCQFFAASTLLRCSSIDPTHWLWHLNVHFVSWGESFIYLPLSEHDCASWSKQWAGRDEGRKGWQTPQGDVCHEGRERWGINCRSAAM